MSNPRLYLLTALLVLTNNGESVAQSSLPESLQAHWNDTTGCWLRPALAGPDAHISFNTEAKQLTVAWGFDIPGSEAQYPVGFVSSDTRTDSHALGYHPTAICRRSGVGSTFYVAGWIDRLSTAIVERWEVNNMAVGTTAKPDGTLTASLTLSYDKEIVFTSDSTGPIRCIAFHTTSDRVWALGNDSPNTLYSIDPTSGSATVQTDAAAHPELASMRSALCKYIDPAAPDGGGFFVLLRQESAWEFIDEPDLQSQVFFTRDSNFDGIVDVQDVRTLASAKADINSAFYKSDYQ